MNPLVVSTFGKCALKKMKFFIKDFFNKCDQIRSFLRICSHLRKKPILENLIFCAVVFSRNLTSTSVVSPIQNVRPKNSFI